MAKRFGCAPADATKTSHEHIRDVFEVVVLATAYGMGPKTLAVKLQTTPEPAAGLLREHHRRYPRFWKWTTNMVDTARIRGRPWAPLGWSIRVFPDMSATTLMNWPVQAAAAEHMRLALVMLVEADVQVDAVIHDAFLVEAETEIEATVATTRRLMADASEIVLKGALRLRTDATVIRPGQHYLEPRGAEMWGGRCDCSASLNRFGQGSKDKRSEPDG
jgi:DNA polymerase I-like protein with 3'-5' exonuclease and polymerase domains